MKLMRQNRGGIEPSKSGSEIAAMEAFFARAALLSIVIALASAAPQYDEIDELTCAIETVTRWLALTRHPSASDMARRSSAQRSATNEIVSKPQNKYAINQTLLSSSSAAAC